MINGFVKAVRKLAGACALAVSSLAFAAPVTVHFAMYDVTGALKSDSSGSAQGDIGTGNHWINSPTLTNSETTSNYLVHFWVDSVAGLEDVKWAFNWSLLTGATVKANGVDAGVDSLRSRVAVAIGTSHSGWRSVAGTLLGGGNASATLGETPLDPGQSVAASASTTTAAPLAWDGGTTTDVWAYVSGSSSSSGQSNVSIRFSAYGIVTAAADVTIAQPLLPDNFPVGDGAGHNAPEPGSLALLAGTGLLAGWRRRRDRLKRLLPA